MPGCMNVSPSLGSLASIPAMLQAPASTEEDSIPQVTTSKTHATVESCDSLR